MVAIWKEPTNPSEYTRVVANTNWVDLVGLIPAAGRESLKHQKSRTADIAVDPTARDLLNLFDRETSIRWGDLANRTGLAWEEICRGVAILAWAGMCEPGPVRIRLSEQGAILLESREQRS